MKIYRLKKDWGRTISNGSIGFHVNHKKGEMFVEQIHDAGTKREKSFYYPVDGGYPVWEREDYTFVEEYFEFIEDSPHNKEYFIEKKYTERDMQEALKNIQP